MASLDPTNIRQGFLDFGVLSLQSRSVYYHYVLLSFFSVLLPQPQLVIELVAGANNCNCMQ